MKAGSKLYSKQDIRKFAKRGSCSRVNKDVYTFALEEAEMYLHRLLTAANEIRDSRKCKTLMATDIFEAFKVIHRYNPTLYMSTSG